MAAWKLDDVGTKPVASNPARALGTNDLILTTGDESATDSWEFGQRSWQSVRRY